MRKRFRWICMMAAMGVVGWIVYIQWLIHAVNGGAVPERTDAGIVLGAALWNDYPSPGLQERLNEAVKLYEKGHFPFFIVTGGLDSNGSTITEAEGMKRYLVEKGIPEEVIFMEKKARSTYQNLLFSRGIMLEKGWQQALIITHEYHAARSLDIAKSVGLENSYVHPVESRVLWMPWHKGRETLAYTKWLLEKWLFRSFADSLMDGNKVSDRATVQ